MNRHRGFIPLSLILYGVAALAIIAALWGVYHSIEGRGYERGKVECAQAAKAQREAEEKQISSAAAKLEAENEKARTVYRTITRTVDRYIDRPVYRNACFDDDGLRDANAALRGPHAPAGKPDAAVPGSDAARGLDRGDAATEDR